MASWIRSGVLSSFIQTGAVFAGGSLWRCLRLAFSALIHRCRQPLASAVHTNRHSDARAAQHDRGLSLTQAVPGDQQNSLALQLGQPRKRLRHQLAVSQLIAAVVGAT